jgi:hypothetical protein
MNDVELEVSDIPLILELSLELTTTEIAEKWEVSSSKLCSFLTKYGHNLTKHRKRNDIANIMKLYDEGKGFHYIAAELDIGTGKVRMRVKEGLHERAKSTS